MKYKNNFLKWFSVSILCIFIGILPGYAAKTYSRQSGVFGPPEKCRLNPYLFNGFSRKKLTGGQTRTSFGYSLLHAGTATTDTIKIIAIRVEFKLDSSFLTTGNGLFGIYRGNQGTKEDLNEINYYKNGAYTYDNLPHDSTYFARHLEFVRKYYQKVSKGRLCIEYEIFPPGPDEKHAYQVPEKMITYSPGAKKKRESWDDYYYRRTVGLMKFVRDAIRSADSSVTSPFKNLYMETDGVLYVIDTINAQITKRKAAILLIHAGASYLTDGGWDGYFGQDTPSDMIDAFISNEFFNYFAKIDTTLGFNTDSTGRTGIWVNKSGANRFVLDELMMVSETSNQDSLNWGINGILVNQVARQIGIPDLFSTMSGISGIGAFCIMDFAGYSTGRGFIPPWPSAWVRAFMGWDTPVIIEPGTGASSSMLTAVSAAETGDTTILLVPINNHEFYLIENRQRNLTGDPTFFNYDTVDNVDDAIDGSVIIDPYDHVNIDKNVTTFTGSSVIDSIINSDVSIPASGILIWHIDEYIIRDHLEQNIVNADSSYRGISLEEADGVVDLGVMFTDVFYQAAFDYGGAADVFPHYTSESSTPVKSIGPFTRPSTQSNDGGHTYLTISIDTLGTCKKEVSIIEGKLVYNYVDTAFQITIGRKTDFVSGFQHWPQRIIPEKFFDPVLCDIYDNGDTLEFAVVDTAGRVYIWTSEGNDTLLYSPVREALPTILYSNETVYTDTISYCAVIPQPAGMPTCVDSSSLYIPSCDGNLYILRSIDRDTALWETVPLNHGAASYVCNYSGTKWSVGCLDGTVIYGDDASSLLTPVATQAPAPIQALAVIDSADGILAAINTRGVLYICSPTAGVLDTAILDKIAAAGLYPPYSLATADLDSNTIFDIVVADRKQGLWLYNYDMANKTLSYSPEWIRWEDGPNDWAGSHRFNTDRASIPDNESAPSIADLDNDRLLDIVVGGTNGIYAYNHRGILLINWPALLDTRYWLQRGSITSSPVIGFGPNSTDPLVLFSSPTGENVTIGVAHIDSVNQSSGTIHFTFEDGTADSIPGLNKSLIDSLLVFGDSLVLPYITPGGFIDAVNRHGKRPATVNSLSNVGKVIQSPWPLSVGGSVNTAPLLCDMDKNGKPDILSVTDGGMVYRWEMTTDVLAPSSVWPQAGACNARTFTYAGPLSSPHAASDKIVHFYNYPNPAKWFDRNAPFQTTFKYQLSGVARSVRLDIFTCTGYHIFSEQNLPTGYGWNEYTISLKKLGSAVYRCRLEADFGGNKEPEVKHWKMAVIK